MNIIKKLIQEKIEKKIDVSVLCLHVRIHIIFSMYIYMNSMYMVVNERISAEYITLLYFTKKKKHLHIYSDYSFSILYIIITRAFQERM